MTNEYSLVMPFTPAVLSGDGPYDDNAFVAGYQCGQIDRSLQVIRAAQGTGMESMVYTPLIPQLELIAMRHGLVLETEDTGTEGWTFVKFRPPSAEERQLT